MNEIKTVYMCFSTDIIHSGHIEMIKRAGALGKLIIGVLSDEAIVYYKRLPLLPYSERKVMFENIKGVSEVVEQDTLSYKSNLERIKPDIVVHGDDWITVFKDLLGMKFYQCLQLMVESLLNYHILKMKNK